MEKGRGRGKLRTEMSDPPSGFLGSVMWGGGCMGAEYLYVCPWVWHGVSDTSMKIMCMLDVAAVGIWFLWSI